MYKIIFILFLGFSSAIQAQELDVELLKNIPNKKSIQFASYDHLGAFYLISNNQISKQFEDKTYNYNNLLYGEITWIDIRNPFQILVFYKNFQSFVVLNNQLNEIQNINFTINYPELDVRIVSASNKNYYWVFDEVSKRIFIYDVGQNYLKPISVPIEFTFDDWNSNANSFFIEANNTIYSYDIYGKVSEVSFSTAFNKVDLVSASTFVTEYQLDLFYHNLKSEQSLKINLPKKSINSFEVINEILTIFTDSEINIYKLKLP